MHSKHSVNSNIEIISKIKKMMKSSTRKLPEGRLWEHPDVHQTCSVADSQTVVDRPRTGSLRIALPVHFLPGVVIMDISFGSSRLGFECRRHQFTSCLYSESPLTDLQVGGKNVHLFCRLNAWSVQPAPGPRSGRHKWAALPRGRGGEL